jgi:membrane protein YqaA with SNARE-associated domain
MHGLVIVTEQLWDQLWNVFRQYSYVGVFLISVLGAISIVVPIPYTYLILILAVEGWDPLLLTLAGGLGSAVGEFSGYLLGYYGRSRISEERQTKMNFMLKVFNRYGSFAVFLFALTPLPDDLLFIPLGILRYSFIKAFVPSLLGKIAMCGILSFGGRLYYDVLSLLFGRGTWESELIISIITAIALIAIVVAMFKIDWERMFEAHVGKEVEKKG